MDSTSEAMFDIFKQQIWKELGPLDPNWFESLTAEALEGHASDQDELCANQEALFKAPSENKGSCSQMCSTPKLFKHHLLSSLQNDSFSAEPEMQLWTKGSPCVLLMEQSQTDDSITLLHSPKNAGLHQGQAHSNSSFGKHISERLGATVGDISWTSSLNTPPPEPATLILSRKGSSSTVSLSEDDNVFVCELFPFDSSVSADRIFPESPDQSAPAVPDAKLNGALQAPAKDKPNASKDADVKTENASCISSTILKKVRNERVNRRLIIPANEKSCNAAKVLPTNTAALSEDKPPSGNTSLTQWSPLSLSEIQQDTGLKEALHESGYGAGVKNVPPSEQNLEDPTDNGNDKSFRSQPSLTQRFGQTSDLEPLPHGFSPSVCLSALKQAKHKANRASKQCKIAGGQDPAPAVKQSSVHDSGFSSMAKTTLTSSNNESLSKSDATFPDCEKELCKTICEKGVENMASDLLSFKTASNKNIHISPVSLAKAKHFFTDMGETENDRHTKADESSHDSHLTFSQKAEVKELCALLEQQSSSQFDFTQSVAENVNRLDGKCPSLRSSETDFTTVKDFVKEKPLLSDGDANETTRAPPENRRPVTRTKVDSDEASSQLEELTRNRFEGDLNACHGFQTASGRGIDVSAKNMEISKNLFKDCDLAPDDVVICNIQNDKESGFKRPRVNIFTKDDMSVEKCSLDSTPFGKPSPNAVICVKAEENTNPKPRRGFKRPHDLHPASSKDGKRAKLLLPDIEGEKNVKPLSSNLNKLEANETLETGIMNVTLPSGFTTAGGKPVQFSRKDLEKVKHLWEDLDDGPKSSEFHPPPLTGTSPFESTSGSKMFDTERDSEDPRGKTKPLLQEHGASTRNNAPSKLPDGYVPETCGFRSASGKALRASAEALHKARAMFDDVSCTSEVSGKSTQFYAAQRTETINDCSSLHLSKDPDDSPLGFRFNAASAKKVPGFESKHGLQDRSSDKAIPCKNDNSVNKGSILCHVSPDETDCEPVLHVPDSFGGGFTTASGKKVAVSEEALIRSKRMLNEGIDLRDGLQDLAGGKVAPGKEHQSKQASNKAPPSKGSSTTQLTNVYLHMGKDVSNSHPFSNLDNGTALNDSSVMNRSGFTHGSRQKAIESGEARNKPMNALTEEKGQKSDVNLEVRSGNKYGYGSSIGNSNAHYHDTPASNVSCVKNSSGGFITASGKKVTVSEEALSKAVHFLTKDIGQDKMDVLSVSPLHSVGGVIKTPSNVSCRKSGRAGFTGAGGERVNASEQSLNKTMNFMSENDDEGDFRFPIGPSPTILGNASSNISGIKNRGGFSTASGKRVIVSEEAVKKAMNSLTEKCDQDSVDVKRRSNIRSSSTHGESLANQNDTTCHNSCRNAFTAARCQKVDEKVERDIDTNVQKKANDLSLPLGRSVTNLDGPPVKNRGRGFSTAGGKVVIVSEEALDKATRFLSEKMDSDCAAKTCTPELLETESSAPTLTPDVMKAPSVPLNVQKDQYSQRPDKKVLQRCSVVNLDAPDLSHCSTTQQRFLAQEALDCTRALLEDEVRSAQSLAKRTEDSRAEGRHLLDESDPPGLGGKSADAALDRRKESALDPVRSCLSGLSKDRRVFRYHVPLQPNITQSHRFGNNGNPQKQTGVVPSAPVGRGGGDLKTSLFVPPFINTRTKSSKDDVKTQKAKEKLATFVPPFKKLKYEDDSTQHKDNFHRESPKTCRFVPPTRSRSETCPDQMDQTSRRSEGNSQTQEQQKPPKHKTTEQEINVTETMETEATQQQGTLLNPENLDLARDLQDMRIRKKSRQNIRPIPGKLFLSKSSRTRLSLKAAVNGQTPRKYSQKQLYTYGVDHRLGQITGETAEEFCFSLLRFYGQESFSDAGGVQLADGGWLVPQRDGTAGKEEFYRALCDTPGVDPKLLSERWVSNHYRWVVWKLASMERSFPASMASVCLTPEQVLLQLKYRYDVEVDHSRRPCLRKIMERDDTSAKTLVLCVCGLSSTGRSSPGPPQDARVRPEASGAVVWLTDGWYTIKAQLDEPLTALLQRGAISEGVKLMTHGAQLLGSQEACPPLEAPESLVLKIFANSTRRVRWDTKLGFYKDPRPFVLPLSSVLRAGGVVSCVDMVVLRVYPLQWMERKPDGGVVFRTERAEKKEARRYNNHKQKTIEAVYAKIKVEFEREEKERMKSQSRRCTVRREDLSRCEDGEELFEAVGDEAPDVEADLTSEQLRSLRAYRRSMLDQQQAVLQERLRRALEEAEAGEGSCPKRDLSTVWRLSIADYREQAGSAVYQLSIWNPSSDLQASLKEGSRYEASNLAASEARTQSGRATVQLTSTRRTHFKNLQASPEWLLTRFQPRASVTFAELHKPGFVPLCGEVDLAGCVINITDPHSPSPAFYLADGCLNLVKVHSLVSLARCGWEDLLEPRGLLCLSNLQLRAGSAGPTPVLYAGDMSTLSTHPRESHLKQALGQLQRDIQDQADFFVRAERQLFEILSSDGLSFPAVNPRTPQTARAGHDLRASVGKSQAAPSSPAVCTPVPPNSVTKKDPRSLKRRRALDYICQFPPPPPLSHLNSGASPSVKKTFLPPRRSLVTPPPPPGTAGPTPARVGALPEENWVHDDELALIDTQELRAADALSD